MLEYKDGACGNKFFQYFSIDNAEAITITGQAAILFVEKRVNEYLNKLLKTVNYPYVVYCDTDSVVGDSKIYVDGEQVTIEDYFNSTDTEYLKHDDFNQNYVKVGKGITKSMSMETGKLEEKAIKYVMKHKVKKRLFKITAPDGNSVTVTEDHSIIVKRKDKYLSVKPTEILLGTDELISITSLTSTNFKVEDLGIQEIDVYDIEVDANHNFFANDILVHNSAYICLDGLVGAIPALRVADKMVVTEFLSKFCSEKLSKIIEAACADFTTQMNNPSQALAMNREYVAQSAVFVAKKRYALAVLDKEGFKYPNAHTKVTGIEIVRSNTPKVVKKALKEALNIILLGDEASFKHYCAEFRKQFESLPLEDIARPSGVKSISEYLEPNGKWKLGTPFHVKAAIVHNNTIDKLNLRQKYGIIEDNGNLKTLALRVPNPVHNDTIAFKTVLPPEFKLESYVDKETQFQKTFVSPIENVATTIGWKSKDVASVTDFFV